MPHGCATNVKKYLTLLGNIFPCQKSMCQEHEKPQEQNIKKKIKFNFQTRNETRLCDSKTKT